MKRPVREKTIAMSNECLKPGCEKPVYCRGLCLSDYRQTMWYAGKGVVSLEKLERQGKIRPTRLTTKEWLIG